VITADRQRSTAITLILALMLALLAISAVACTGDAEDTSTTLATLQPLTPPQAMRIAQTLHQNHEAGGPRSASLLAT